MQYQEALDYLYSRLPVFHRIGPIALKPGLDNTLRLCEALGNPQHQFRSIHVAGTNGKGSTSHMLAAIYQSAGYRVGLYTSPHLKSFTERIRLDGQPIAEDEVALFVTTHQSLIESIEPSFFEVTVAMAFDYFARQQPDVAIIEVGLGGRLDSTNVITPLASVITNIGLDHTDILGDTLPKIAREKAGITKAGIPLIIGETQSETTPVFTEIANQLKAPIVFADQLYTVADAGLSDGVRNIRVQSGDGETLSYTLDLTGGYQLLNVATALATVQALQSILPVSTESIQTGLQAVVPLTGLNGRFQTLHQQPRVIVDTAHNKPGLEALFTTIQSIPFASLRLVIGLVADKDRTAVLLSLPESAIYYFCQADSPRSLPAATLQAEAASLGRMGTTYPDVNRALAAALQQATPDDLILVTGSNYHIAELIKL
ncbi:bifunctional folylpolyglutamate synthase/dihydrofolate synthase [Spirosoma aureum]|uniref:Dihydrofolate synthase/folylpolyglutamate synthase n=1 Tax=Spirosoma aureum TaxID=2692134 RepID=A0A6G9AQD2_9BACT|nr:folylpolyglutamate synthase/dihydrofolate synthase family protein [Spirosoma aureum]QIP14578.1 bifunctional folylpolyglutamate synthase/dihydrofolate synthase [Spirosoma aureum]